MCKQCCKEGAGILSIVKEDDRVAFLKKRLAVNEFIRITKLDRSPEKRFRFFDKYVKVVCQQWKESRRSLIDNIVNNSNKRILKTKQNEKVQHCNTRDNCRWFNQQG